MMGRVKLYRNFSLSKANCIVVALILETFIQLTCAMCELPKVKNGFGRRKPGNTIKYFCRKGFYLLGNKMSTCRNGRWMKPAPHCIASGCEIPIGFENGRVTASRRNALLTYECNLGYILIGNEHAYCDGRSWSRSPTCQIASELQGCDFEYSNLCGWTQDGTDDFDWTRNTGPTTTGRTGPSFDHTFSSSKHNGHYVFIETSTPRRPGDIARLLSPVFPAEKSGRCFRFWYHMLGPPAENEVGVLQVKLRHDSDDKEQILFEIEGNQGDEWKQGEVYIDRMTSSFQLIISGTRKQSYVGDIAVDDLEFYDCEDLPYPATTTVTVTTIRHSTDVNESAVSTGGSSTTTNVVSAETTNTKVAETTKTRVAETTNVETTTPRSYGFESSAIDTTKDTITAKSSYQPHLPKITTTERTPTFSTEIEKYSIISKTVESISHDLSSISTTWPTINRKQVSVTNRSLLISKPTISEDKISKSPENKTKDVQISASQTKQKNLSKQTKTILLSSIFGCLVIIITVISIITYFRIRRKRKKDKESFDDLHNAHAVYRKTSTDILIQ